MTYGNSDPLVAAMLRNRSSGLSFGGGSILVPQTEQRMQQLYAQQLLGADPASARTKGEGISRLGQQLLGAYLAREGIDAERAQRDGDSALTAAALRSQDRTPTTFTNDAGERETITWNKPDPSTMTSILGQGSPRLQEAGLMMTMNQRQRDADRAAKTVSTLSPAEVKAMGLPPGSVVQRDAYGKLDVVNKPDVFMPLDGSAPAGGLPPASTPTGGTQTVPRSAGGMTAAPLRPAIERAAAEAGIDPALALTTAHIESGMGTAADRKGSQYQGVFQMGDDRWREAGGTPESRGDQTAQVNVGVKSLGLTRDQLAQKLGRQPEPWETYLAHQQGVTGAAALLSNPDASAVQTLAPFYKDGRNLQAILGNIPGGGEGDANISSRDFANLWRDHFGAIGRSYGLGVRPQAAQAPAGNGPQDVAAQDMAAGLADPGRAMPLGDTIVPDAQPVQVADARILATDAAPAPAPQKAATPRVGMFKGQIMQQDPVTGAILPYQKPPEPTELTKLRMERDALPAGSPDRALYDAEINKKAGGGKPQGFEVESDLRDKFNGLQPVKNFREVVPIYQSMKDAMGRDNPAADLNLVYGVAKIMDPASVVREGETQMAVATGSPAERFAGMFNYIVGGGRLTGEMRQNLFKEAESRLTGHQTAYNQTRDQYMDLAQAYGVDPKRSIIDIRLPEEPAAGQQSGQQATTQGEVAQGEASPATITNDDAGRAAYEALPSGAVFVAPDGTTRRKP